MTAPPQVFAWSLIYAALGLSTLALAYSGLPPLPETVIVALFWPHALAVWSPFWLQVALFWIVGVVVGQSLAFPPGIIGLLISDRASRISFGLLLASIILALIASWVTAYVSAGP